MNSIQYAPLKPGDIVILRLTGEHVLVYEDIPHTANDPSQAKTGQKYVGQRTDGSKVTFFACAADKASETD